MSPSSKPASTLKHGLNSAMKSLNWSNIESTCASSIGVFPARPKQTIPRDDDKPQAFFALQSIISPTRRKENNVEDSDNLFLGYSRSPKTGNAQVSKGKIACGTTSSDIQPTTEEFWMNDTLIYFVSETCLARCTADPSQDNLRARTMQENTVHVFDHLGSGVSQQKWLTMLITATVGKIGKLITLGCCNAWAQRLTWEIKGW